MSSSGDTKTEKQGVFCLESFGSYLAKSSRHWGAQGGYARVWSPDVNDALVVGATRDEALAFLRQEFQPYEQATCGVVIVEISL